MAEPDLPRTSELIVDAPGERLDVFVARRMPWLSRSRIQRLIADGRILVDGRPARSALRIEPPQLVAVTVPEALPIDAIPEALPLDILYEDKDIIVVNKAAGMTVHPAPGHRASTLVNAILAHSKDLSGIGGALRPGIVHRLDRDTSGVILVAKNDLAHNALAKQLKERRVEKVYLALVEGTPKPAEGVIDAAIARDPRNRKRMAVVANGRESVTAYRVLERLKGVSLVEARPRSGRTHQIRVHLAAIGHPIIGDRVYGKASPIVGRQCLHASKIAFAHPRTGAAVAFEAPLPDDLRAAIERFRA